MPDHTSALGAVAQYLGSAFTGVSGAVPAVLLYACVQQSHACSRCAFHLSMGVRLCNVTVANSFLPAAVGSFSIVLMTGL
jgi:hypothetical protein